MSRQSPDPEVSEDELHAYLDGELSESDRARVERYLAAYPAEAERLAAYRRNEDTLRSALQRLSDASLRKRDTDGE